MCQKTKDLVIHQTPTLGGGSGGARTVMVGGSAVKLAVEELVRKGRAAAGELLEAAEAESRLSIKPM